MRGRQEAAKKIGISRPPQMVEGREDAKSGSEKLDSEILTDEQWSGRELVTAPSILRRP